MNRRYYSLAILATAMLAFFTACKQDAPAAAKALTLESQTIERKNGPDCDKPDTLVVNCAMVKFIYPVLKDGPDSLKQSVDAWAKEFMTTWVGMAEEPDNLPPLDEAINGFFNMHAEQVKEMPDGPANFVAETWDTVLLNDGKHLTLMMDGYSYMGGAHPSGSSSVATWDVATAKKITLDQLVTDLDALKQIAEKKFREVRADIFKPGEDGTPGFEFDEVFQFKLADNTGLVKDGIYFIYVPYEVGPYAIGETEFVIPFADIQAIKK